MALTGRPPDPMRTWDAAMALGAAVVAHHPGIERCKVAVHGNRRSGLRWRLGRDSAVWLHWALAPHVQQVIAVISGDDAAWQTLQRELPPPKPPRLQPVGRVHDLRELAVQARAHLPRPAPLVHLTWGRFSARPPTRTLRLGSCALVEPPLVRIHPVLDHETVPGWFVSFVVFHELLHLLFPPAEGEGRRVLHSAALRAAEAAHPDHARAEALERAQVREWLRRCRQRR
ncbi:MAG: hypothetical protein R3F59_29145 [Myxococcota bacterium]